MASLYDNTSNIYRTDFRSVKITDSGTFSLPSEEAKQVQIFNDINGVLRIYKTDTDEFAATISGTSSCAGVFFDIEDGNTYDINGVGNAEQISVQRAAGGTTTDTLKYVISR